MLGQGITKDIEIREVLTRLMDGRQLTAEEMVRCVRSMVDGRWDDLDTSAFLVCLRMKGETAADLAAAAGAVRERMVRLETGRDDVLDTCGTGGDGRGSFNISTATALVAAGCGIPVVKHGNRASSGASGSADVLEILGLRVGGGCAAARRSLDSAGMAFCFAPDFHPALRQVANIRRRLGVRTLFNMLGPLTNPAAAPYQLIGVGRVEWLDCMAHAAALLGLRHGYVVCGHDGLDEITLAGATLVREVREGQMRALEWMPADFGLRPCGPGDLHADGPAASAEIIRRILDGQDGPATRVVLANAAAALLAAGRVSSLREGVELAESALRLGRPKEVLARLVACSAVGPAPGVASS